MRLKASLVIVFALSFVIVCAIFFIPFGSYVANIYAKNSKEEQSLSTQEVQEMLKKMKVTDAKIVDIRMSPVQGLWEVAIEYRGRYDVLYIDASRKYLIGGRIIEVDEGVDRTRERIEELNSKKKVDLSRIPLEDALLLGDKKANKKVIVFTDPDCPYCAKFHKEIKSVVAKRKDIVFYIKLMPLPMHPEASWKSKSIICSKSLKLLEDNFEKKPIPKPKCETKTVDETLKIAEQLGINGTPTSIMPDGSLHVGFSGADELIGRIERAEARKKGM